MPTTALHDLAARLHDLAPWDWMQEDQIIRLIHPDTGEHGHISIMGSMGEHRALALYIGAEALARFHFMNSDDPSDPAIPKADLMALILETRQLQCSYGTRSELRPDELSEIKKLGRKYRGDNWPMFRSFHPGRAPGPLDEAERAWLAHAIEQLMTVAPALKIDPLGDARLIDGGLDILTRRQTGGTWESCWTELDDYTFEWPVPAPDEIDLEKIKALDRLTDIECLFQLMPSPIGRSAADAVFPYLAITADRKSGLILGTDLLTIEKQSHAGMIASVPGVFLRQWLKAGIRPASINVSSITTYSMLEITADLLNTPMRRGDQLPAIDRMLREMPF